MVAAVAFDYYFTLADPSATTDETIAALLSDVLPGMTPVEFDRARTDYLARRLAVGTPRAPDGDVPPLESYGDRWRSYGAELFAEIGVQGAGERFAAARYAAHATAPLYPDAQPALEILRSGSLRIGVLSDADVGYLQDNMARNDVVVDAIVASEEFRCYKPHPSMFEEICRRLGHPPGDTAFVGDNPANDIEGAVAAGLTAIWINRTDSPWPLDTCPYAELSTLTDLSSLLGL